MASIEARAIRRLSAADIDAAVPLAVEAGWNQVAADWRFMIERGTAFGVDAPGGGLSASALVLPLGPALSWISMVLVTHSQRRFGLGTRLLKHCIARVGQSGAVAGLDATELGRPIYLPLGFGDLYCISRYRLERRPGPGAPPPGVTLAPMTAQHVDAVSAWDRMRSGMQRGQTIAHLRARQPGLAWVARCNGQIGGYVLAREGRMAIQIGPIVADTPDIAVALAARAMGAAPAPFFCDAIDDQTKFCAWLQASGAVAPRSFIRMTLGSAPSLANKDALYVIGGPELG